MMRPLARFTSYYFDGDVISSHWHVYLLVEGLTIVIYSDTLVRRRF